MPSDVHGTTACYSGGCRCPDCSEAKRTYDRARRARLEAERPPLVRHGTASAWDSCDCEVCASWKAQHEEAERRHVQRRRQWARQSAGRRASAQVKAPHPGA